MHTAFPIGVADHVKVYVYRLIDPRNGETFYVGKGRGDRVFQHAAGAESSFEGVLPDKMERIRAIRLAGLEVAHVIHRHGLDDATAFEVEAALIDAYTGLTNRQTGHGAGRGAAHAESIILRYAAKEIDFKHSVVMITINRTSQTSSPYEAVRYAWKLGLKSVAKAELVLAVERGRVVGVFRPEKWLLASSENFPGRPDQLDRFGFVGVEAEAEVRDLYLQRKVPNRYRTKGAANPVKYAGPPRIVSDQIAEKPYVPEI